jgi:hypothetical protein
MRGLAHRTSAGWTLLACLLAPAAHAGPADVVAAVARCSGAVCHFRVTVEHTDEGWSHYANAWEVVGPDGAVLATRELLHPHVGEQPFTRELRDVAVPLGVTRVRIRARDSVHGLGGREETVELTRSPAPARGSPPTD